MSPSWWSWWLHAVVQDRTVGGAIRFTCSTCGVTIAYELHMSAHMWDRVVAEFHNQHPGPIRRAE